MVAVLSPTHFNSYSSYLRLRFGGRVAKVGLDLGIPCPHRKRHGPGCTFCRPGVIMADRIGALGSIVNQINGGMMVMGARFEADLFLAYFQNETNTAGDLEWLLARYDEALLHPKMSGIVISTRPDMLPDALLDLLQIRARRKPVFLELGLQSIHKETLRRINRGHDFATFEEAVYRANERGLPVCAHVILGLPHETPEMMSETFRALGKLPIDSVKIHHLQVYRGAPMELAWWNGEVPVFESLEDYLPVLLDCLEWLPWRVKIQRLVADAPLSYVLAPHWNLVKNQVISEVEAAFINRGTRQGYRVN
jgi:radical SAM protein (TIGR01212 family)